jgi:hypothetical protein
MDVTFTLEDLGDEAAVRQALAEARLPEEAEHLWGGITLAHPGQPDLLLRDDLQSIAGVLCGAVALRLRNGQPADLSLVGAPGLWQWRPQADDTVAVQTDDGQQAVYPRAALADALAACGRRLVACLEAMGELAPHRATAARRLSVQLEASERG